MHKISLLLMITCLLYSCTSNKVDLVIEDEQGAKIENAEVEPVALSIGYEKIFSNKNGEVDLKLGQKVQGVKWVNIHKEGYEKQYLEIDHKKLPIKIVLKKK